MNLYEIVYVKNESGTERKYQIPETSEYNALVKLGQTFCSDETEIKIVSIICVGSK